MRAAARRFGRDVHCHQQFLMVEGLPGVSLQQTLGQLDKSERLAAIGWLTRGGPFWEDLRRHGAGDWLEYRGEVVTDTAVGEAAFRALHGVTSGLLSVTPSDWSFSLVEVTWREPPDNMRDRAVALENWWNAEELERSLQTAEPQISSWANLRHVSTARFASLTFAGDCFEPLSGIPFLPSAADRIRALLQILDRFARAFDASGKRTPNGQRVYQNYFTGDSAPFSDSSDKEKRRFNKELTFHDPNNPGRYLLCPWHGKVADFSIHFSWPIRFGEPVYVVYVGLKITRR